MAVFVLFIPLLIQIGAEVPKVYVAELNIASLCRVKHNENQYRKWRAVKPECKVRYEELAKTTLARLDRENIHPWVVEAVSGAAELADYTGLDADEITTRKSQEEALKKALEKQAKLAHLENQKTTALEILLLDSKGIVLDYYYFHHHKVYNGSSILGSSILGSILELFMAPQVHDVALFAGIMRRTELSPKCHPTDDLDTWNNDLLVSARHYKLYEVIKQKLPKLLPVCSKEDL